MSENGEERRSVRMGERRMRQVGRIRSGKSGDKERQGEGKEKEDVEGRRR